LGKQDKLINSLIQKCSTASPTTMPSTPRNVLRAYLILDTNVLMHSLKLVTQLTTKVISWCTVSFVLPYTAFQELDRKKKDHQDAANAKKAKEACLWLSWCAQNLKESGVQLEHRKQVQKNEACNDDRILAVAERTLVVHKKHAGVLVFLVTWDRNLQSKALWHNVPVLNSEELLQNPKCSEWNEKFFVSRK
jgi:predicted ribonuclease YlaK